MARLGSTESIQDWGAQYVIGGAGALGSGVCWGRTVFDKLPVSQSSGGSEAVTITRQQRAMEV